MFRACKQARISAAKELLDRGYGKSPQALEVEMTNVRELLALLEAGRQRNAQRDER